MKTAKKTLAFILVLTMIFALGVPAFASFNPETSEDTFNYVSFGASNTMGYGLHGFTDDFLYDDPSVCYEKDSEVLRDGFYTSGYFFWPKDCYPELVKKTLQDRFDAAGDSTKVILNQCAINSMRAYDLRYILDENCPADGYIKWRLGDEKNGWIHDLNRARYDEKTVNGVSKIYEKEETNLREDFAKAIKTADLITYDLGVNDFGVFVANNIGSPYYEFDLADIVGEENVAKFDGIRDKIRETLVSLVGDDTVETLDYYVDLLTYAYVGFVTSFDAAMGYIYEVNPDVDVVVISIQNLPYGSNLKLGDITVPLGDLFGAILDMANAYTATLSPYADKYSYADVRQNGHVEFFADELMAWDGDPKTLSQNMQDCFNAYDSAFLTATLVKAEIAKKGLTSDAAAALYEKAELAACYGMAKFALMGVSQNDLVVKSFDDLGDKTKFNGSLRDIVYKGATDKLAGGASLDETLAYIDTELGNLVKTDADRTLIKIWALASYANCFFYHPNVTGHVQLKNAVMKAYDNQISGKQAALNSVAVLTDKIVKGAVNYGTQFIYSVLDEAAAKFGLDENVVGILKTLMPDSEYAAAILINLIGDEYLDDIFYIVDNTEKEIVDAAHNLKHVNARPASFFSAGNKEYYVCKDCGKCFSDPFGACEISQDSVTVAKLGVKDIVNYIINLFTKLLSGDFLKVGPQVFGK